MRISVITITTKADAKLLDMGRALVASLDRCKAGRPDLTLEWLILDDVPRSLGEPMRALHEREDVLINHLQGFVANGDLEPWQSANQNRNTGLMKATGDYVVFLAENTLVTVDWVGTVALLAEMGMGYRARQLELADLKVDWSKPLTHGAIAEKKWRPAPSSTVGGSCWGAPMVAFHRVGGFDLAFDGEPYGHDYECALRLERVGVRFVSTTRAVAIHLRRTVVGGRAQANPKQENNRGIRNKTLIAQLIAERDRTLPRQGSASLTPPSQPAPAATDAVAGASAAHTTTDPGRTHGAARAKARVARPAAARPQGGRPRAVPSRPAAVARPPAAAPARGGAKVSGGAPAEVPRDPDAGAHGGSSSAPVVALEDQLRNVGFDVSDVNLDGPEMEAFLRAVGDSGDFLETADADGGAEGDDDIEIGPAIPVELAQRVEELRALAEPYLERIARNLDLSVDDLARPGDLPMAPYETYPAIVWVSPENLGQFTLANPGCVTLTSADRDKAREIWPPAPSDLLADRWGPTEERSVAVAAIPQ